MLLKQLFDHDTYTFTYLLACESTRQAAIIDPVRSRIKTYLQLLNELDLTLTFALDTHIHADHITALSDLKKHTACQTYLSNLNEVSCASSGLSDGMKITLGELTLSVIYTPGHTDDSYCFHLYDNKQGYLFTGDTLLIRGTGRTDFQNGSAIDLYQSLHNKVLSLPDNTIVFPGHDYRGFNQSTLGEEKAHNPRLQVKTQADFCQLMANLNLPNPKHMDVAVPANRQCGNN